VNSDRPLRADAALNRDRILAAARPLFAARGLDVSIEDIAQAAGVGATTVVRRFRDQNGLIAALFEDEFATNAALAHTAIAAADGGEGLVEFLRTLFQKIATDRGIAQVLLSDRYGSGEIPVYRREFSNLVRELIERARREGYLRGGVEASDIPVLLMMVGSVADFARATKPELWQRYSELLIEAVVPSNENDAWQGTALTPTQLAEAMQRWRPRQLRP
jgi:AcrR family transcriptional regulator